MLDTLLDVVLPIYLGLGALFFLVTALRVKKTGDWSDISVRQRITALFASLLAWPAVLFLIARDWWRSR